MRSASPISKSWGPASTRHSISSCRFSSRQNGEQWSFSCDEPPTKEPIAVTVAAQDLDQRKALAKANKEPQRGEAEPLWRFEQLDDRTAYLRMPSWALYNSKWDWQGFLERGLDDLIDRRVPGLIVDLRGNEGGQDVGNTLIARIAPDEGPLRPVPEIHPLSRTAVAQRRSMPIWTHGTGRSRTGARRPRTSATGFSA